MFAAIRRASSKEKRPPLLGGLRDSKSPIPPKKNGLTTRQSFRRNTVDARAIKSLPCVLRALSLTGKSPPAGRTVDFAARTLWADEATLGCNHGYKPSTSGYSE